MIDEHDLTYESSDGRYYNRGRKQAEDITKYVAEHNIDRKTFAEIWNANVDKKIAPDYRSNYYMAVNYD
jgi:hypothetical protein